MNRFVCVGAAALLVAACGGDDSGIINGPPDDSGVADSGNGADGSMNGKDGSMMGGDAAMGDGGGGGDAAPDAPPFSVGGVLGLALWLDAAKDVTVDSKGNVSAWGDQSGNKNNAAQSNTNFQPQQQMGKINSLPVVHFTATVGKNNFGNMMTIPDSATLDWADGDFLIEVVGEYDNAPQSNFQQQIGIGAGTFYSKQGSNGSIGGFTQGAALYGNYAPAPGGMTMPDTGIAGWVDQSNLVHSATTGYNDNKPHLFAVQRAGTTLSLRVGGTQTDMQTIAAVSVDGMFKPQVRIGASGDATIFRLNGDIAEMIAVKGSISSTDLAGIEGYLKTKYGL